MRARSKATAVTRCQATAKERCRIVASTSQEPPVSGAGPQREGAALAEELARSYGASWYAAPVPVDVCRFATRFGAYTLLGPTQVTLPRASAKASERITENQ